MYWRLQIGPIIHHSLARARPMKNNGLVKLIHQSCVECPGMFGQNNEFSVAMVNRTVKYECVKLLRSDCSCTAAYAVVKETTDEG